MYNFLAKFLAKFFLVISSFSERMSSLVWKKWFLGTLAVKGAYNVNKQWETNRHVSSDQFEIDYNRLAIFTSLPLLLIIYKVTYLESFIDLFNARAHAQGCLSGTFWRISMSAISAHIGLMTGSFFNLVYHMQWGYILSTFLMTGNSLFGCVF